MLEHTRFAYEEIDEYLKYSIDDAMNGRRSIELKIYSFNKFCDYMIGTLRIYSISGIGKDELQKWVDHMLALDCARTTMGLLIGHVFSFWRWCIAKGYIPDQEAPLLRKSAFKFKGKPPRAQTVIRPEEIFRMRTSGYGTLGAAVIFEIALCTGMRMGEVLQLRASDIEWGKLPNDKELNSPSPYVVATILVYPMRHAIKVRKHKRMYLSRIAGKLLLLWMEDKKIPPKSDLPLFPYSRKYGWEMMCKLADKCHVKSTSVQPHLDKEESAYDVDEMYGMLDVSLNDVEDKLLKSMIVRVRKQEQKKRKLLRMGVVGERKKFAEQKARASALNPHTLRYTNICFMWFRCFTGERQNELAIKMTTGHGVNRQMLHYLIDNDVIKNEIVWKKLWIGLPDHWGHIFCGSKNDRTRGKAHEQRNNAKWNQ